MGLETQLKQLIILQRRYVPVMLSAPSTVPSRFGISDKERLVTLQQWAVSNPHVLVPVNSQRDIARENIQFSKYLQDEAVKNPDYFAYLQNLMSLGSMSPMTPDCRVAVNIPAWLEGKRIYQTLKMYSSQVDASGTPLDPDLWEINIYNDRTVTTHADDTVEQIEKFKLDSEKERTIVGQKPLHINYVDVLAIEPLNTVGHARKVLTDLTLMRAVQRPTKTGPLYIESEDCDLENVDHKVISNALTTLDENPKIDFVKGIEDRNPEIMMKNDYLFFRNRCFDFITALLKSPSYRDYTDPNYSFRWNRIVTGGWNTAFSAEAYAIAKGYDVLSITGEDLDLGEKLSIIRGSNGAPNLNLGKRVPTRYDSSPRRFLNEIIENRHAYSDGAFNDTKLNIKIRDLTLDQLLDQASFLARIDPTNQSVFESVLQKQLDRARSKVPQDAYIEFTNKVLLWLGFDKKSDYLLDETGRLVVTNWDNVKNHLDQYRHRHSRSRQPGERIRHTNA